MRPPPFWPSPIASWIVLGAWIFGSMGLAIVLYPQPYSWEHTVISTLASPRDNPKSYLIACISLAGTGLLFLPFAPMLTARLGRVAPRTVSWAGRCLRVGAVALVLAAIFVPGHYRVLGLSRVHERLAQVSGVAFSFALILYFVAVLRLPSDRRWLKLAAAAVTILPIAIFVSDRITGWSMLALGHAVAYRELSAAAWKNLALWEWLAASSIYSFLGLVVFFVRPTAETNGPVTPAESS